VGGDGCNVELDSAKGQSRGCSFLCADMLKSMYAFELTGLVPRMLMPNMSKYRDACIL
jgi:hypothetical protein